MAIQAVLAWQDGRKHIADRNGPRVSNFLSYRIVESLKFMNFGKSMVFSWIFLVGSIVPRRDLSWIHLWTFRTFQCSWVLRNIAYIDVRSTAADPDRTCSHMAILACCHIWIYFCCHCHIWMNYDEFRGAMCRYLGHIGTPKSWLKCSK